MAAAFANDETLETQEIRVLIVGAVSGNGGDAAILLATHRAVCCAAPDRRIVLDVVDSNPEMTRRIIAEANDVFDSRPAALGARRSRRARLGAKVRRVLTEAGLLARPAISDPMTLPSEAVTHAIGRADVVVYTGGTSLVEHYELGGKFGVMRTALLMGKPLVLATQSLGPFARPQNIERMRVAAAGAAAVLLRDERSLRHLREIDADTGRAELLPDVAFVLADLQRLARDRSPSSEGAPVRVAVSTRAWSHFASRSARAGHRRYVRALAGVTTWLVNEIGAEVTFLSTCQGIDSYWADDSACAAEVVASLEPGVRALVLLRRDHVAPELLRDAYGGFDLVVATRMHAAILALCAGTPVVPISYEFKTKELFGSLGLPELVIDIEEVTASGLIEVVRAALARLPQLRTVLGDVLPGWADDAALVGVRIVEAAS